MSVWTDITKPLRKLGDHIEHGLEHADKMLREHGAPDFYIGGTTGDYGETWQPNFTSLDGSIITGANAGAKGVSPSTIKPNAYRANVAGTASSIKQGGMTKDEIIDFNNRHPNETMMRGQ